jgi:quinol monooxygenase YgiN
VIIVGGSFRVSAEQRSGFVASRLDLMRRSRAEPGCLEYTFSEDPLDDGRVLLFERWVDQESLNAHLAVPGDPSGAPVAPTSFSITFYDVTGEKSFEG